MYDHSIKGVLDTRLWFLFPDVGTLAKPYKVDSYVRLQAIELYVQALLFKILFNSIHFQFSPDFQLLIKIFITEWHKHSPIFITYQGSAKNNKQSWN